MRCCCHRPLYALTAAGVAPAAAAAAALARPGEWSRNEGGSRSLRRELLTRARSPAAAAAAAACLPSTETPNPGPMNSDAAARRAYEGISSEDRRCCYAPFKIAREERASCARIYACYYDGLLLLLGLSAVGSCCCSTSIDERLMLILDVRCWTS
jgi:hypothetical protein